MSDRSTESPEESSIDPSRIHTRSEFVAALGRFHDRSGLTFREAARGIRLTHQAVNGYVRGKHLPQAKGRNSELFIELLRAGYGVEDESALNAWTEVLRRVASAPGPRRTDETVPYPGLRPFQKDEHDWFFGRVSSRSSKSRSSPASPRNDGLWLWNYESGAPPSRIPSNGPVEDLAVHPEDGAVFAGYADGSVKRWELPGTVLTASTDVVFNIEFLRDGTTLATVNGDGSLWLWDLGAPGRAPSPTRELRSPDSRSRLIGAISGNRSGCGTPPAPANWSRSGPRWRGRPRRSSTSSSAPTARWWPPPAKTATPICGRPAPRPRPGSRRCSWATAPG